MKTRATRLSLLPLLLSVFILAACSSTDSRIKKNQQTFDALPAETQTNIRAGKIEIGYTHEMVLMAIGTPDRQYTRTTPAGTAEVWAYRSSTPSFSFGLGMGGGGGSTSVGTGVGVTTGGDQGDDKVRVIFEGGKVTAVEMRTK